MKLDPSSTAADAEGSRRWEGGCSGMLGHRQMEESQAGTENCPAFHPSGQGFQQRSLSLGVKVARGVEEKSKEMEAREKVTRGTWGKRRA